MTMMRTTTTLLIAAFVTILMSGCIFDPRDPEVPGGNQVTYLNRGDAANIIENLQRALNNLDIGGYEDAIGDEFRADDVNIPAFDEESWRREQEISFATWLFSNNQKILMDRLAGTEEFTDVSAVHREYTILYSLEITDNAGQTKKYRASALVDVKQIGSFWYVDRWVDQVGEVDPDTGNQLETMGSLRAAFVSK